MQEKIPRRVRVLDKRDRPRWNAIWDHNPRFAPPGWKGEVQTTTNGPGRRPYIQRETPRRWLWRECVCPVGEIHLSACERAFGARHAGRIILEPNLTGKASPNKDWGWKRWTELGRQMLQRGHTVTQLGPPGTPLLPGADLIVTPGFREACAVLAGARLAVLPEGGLHHAAAALGIPAVVIFGGYISPLQTGYAHQISLYTGGEPCGMRAPCAHCATAMKEIDPGQVLADALTLLDVRGQDGVD